MEEKSRSLCLVPFSARPGREQEVGNGGLVLIFLYKCEVMYIVCDIGYNVAALLVKKISHDVACLTKEMRSMVWCTCVPLVTITNTIPLTIH